MRSRLFQITNFLALALAQTFAIGYYYGISNHAIQIPFLRGYANQALYPGDPFVEARHHYPSLYYWLLAQADKALGNLPLLFFLLHIATTALAFAAIFAITKKLFRRDAVAWIATILFLGQRLVLADGILFDSIHTHDGAALPLLLWAVYFALNTRWMAMYGLQGFAWNLHLVSAAPVVGVLAVGHLCWVIARKENLWRVLGHWVFFAALTLPINWAVLQSIRSLPIDSQWLEAMRLRSDHHIFPFSWGWRVWAEYLCFAALGMSAVHAMRSFLSGKLLYSLVLIAVFCLVELCTLGIIGSEIFPIKTVINAQLLRSTRYLTLLFMIFGAATFYFTVRFGDILTKIWGALLLVAIVVPSTLLVLAPALVFWRVAFGLRYGVALVPALAFFGEGGGIAYGRAPRAPHLAWGSAYALVICTLLAGRYQVAMQDVEKQSWVQVQRWARDNTPPSALFLTPPETKGFRVHSERSTLAEWKDGTALFYSNDLLEKWLERIHAIGTKNKNYFAMKPAELLAVAHQYGAKYVVWNKNFPTLPLPLVFERGSWRVYKIN